MENIREVLNKIYKAAFTDVEPLYALIDQRQDCPLWWTSDGWMHVSSLPIGLTPLPCHPSLCIFFPPHSPAPGNPQRCGTPATTWHACNHAACLHLTIHQLSFFKVYMTSFTMGRP